MRAGEGKNEKRETCSLKVVVAGSARGPPNNHSPLLSDINRISAFKLGTWPIRINTNLPQFPLGLVRPSDEF